MGKDLSVKLAIERVLNEFFEVHGTRYDYSRFSHSDSRTKSVIICSSHGEFEQAAIKHKRGRGCPRCADAARNNSRRVTIADFLTRAKAAHGDTYDYSKVSIIDTASAVSIRCFEHGAFLQRPEKHLASQGCPRCRFRDRGISQRNTKKDFVKEALRVYSERYDYGEVDYQGAHIHVDILCDVHEVFRQTPRNHISGNGCPSCTVGRRMSSICNQWMESLAIDDLILEYQLPEIKRIFVDGFSPSTNTIYQFHGDYWHGNPSAYDPNKINAHSGQTFEYLYQRTLRMDQNIIDLGYNLIVMWEYDWRRSSSHTAMTEAAK